MNWILAKNPDKRNASASSQLHWADRGKGHIIKKEKPMTSASKETRLKQKAEWEAKLQKREALLAAKGRDAKTIASDIQIRELKAKIKESNLRLRAIAATEKRTGELAAAKAERLAKPKEEALTKKQKKAEAPPPETKAAAKKKKKKDEGSQAQ
jgi:hypothetical protein